MSVNIELPSEASLKALAPDKTRASILTPMAQIREGILESGQALRLYRGAPDSSGRTVHPDDHRRHAGV